MVRRYTEKEKQLIRILCKTFKAEDGLSYYGMNPIYRLFERTYFTIDYSKDEENAVYTCCLNDGAPVPGKYWDANIVHEIFETALLLYELEEDKFVYFLMKDKPKPITEIKIFRLVGENGRMTEHCVANYDLPPTVSEILTKDVHGIFKVSQTLTDLCENNFRTPEDIALEEANQQTVLAKQTLSEALLQTRKAQETLEKAIVQVKYARWTFIASLISIGLTLLSLYCK